MAQENFVARQKGKITFDKDEWNHPDYVILTEGDEQFITKAGKDRGMENFWGVMPVIHSGVAYDDSGKAPVFKEEMIQILRKQIRDFEFETDDNIWDQALKSGAINVSPSNVLER